MAFGESSGPQLGAGWRSPGSKSLAKDEASEVQGGEEIKTERDNLRKCESKERDKHAENLLESRKRGWSSTPITSPQSLSALVCFIQKPFTRLHV